MSLADDFLNGATGVIIDHAGIFLPSGGWAWANGQALNRVTEARLFNKLCLSTTGNATSGNGTIDSIPFDLMTLDHSPVGWPVSGPGIQAGTTIIAFTSNSITVSPAPNATATGVAIVLAPHGVGDGSTTFNVPDVCGRVVAGRDNMGGTAKSRITAAGGLAGTTLGKAAGAETHTLSAAEMPAHNHGVNDPTHTHANTLSDPGHNHATDSRTAYIPGGGGNGEAPGSGIAISNASLGTTVVVTGVAIHNAGVATGISTQNAGAGSAHAIMQPTIVLNKIIKT